MMEEPLSRKVISFDGDNTLWDFEKAQKAALESVLKVISELRSPSVLPSVERMIAIREEVVEEWGEGTTSLLALRRESLRRAAAEAQLDASDSTTDLLLETFVVERDRANNAYSNVSEVLSVLKADGWTIALLTNGNANAEATGLAGFFDHLLYAEETGARKPDIAAFESVANATACKLKEIIHVGDSPEHDVAGANNAGAVSVWLNRHKVPNHPGIRPDFEIASMDQLPGVLKSLI